MSEYRKAIIKLHLQRKSERQIAESLGVPKTTVHDIISRFNETGINERRPGSGRPRTARTKANVRSIKGRIKRNSNSRKNSTREIGKALGISDGSVRNILHKDLGMKSRKKAKGQFLNQNAKQKSLDRCKRLKRRFAAGRHRSILFTDEKLFKDEQSFNSQNHRDWSVEPLPLEQRIISRQQKPKQIMVWAGIHWSKGKTPLVFIAEGVKVDGRVYREMLEDKVFPWARKAFGDEHWTFQQDGAPSHKAVETQELIEANCPDFISVDISPQRANGEWPPCRPDLNVMDYSIWSWLEERACSKPCQSIQSLKKSLKKAWDELPLKMIQKAIDDFPKRLQKCIDANGGHFENK